MSDFIDLVVCEVHETKALFQAPRWSELHKGDDVVVELHDTREDATVIDSLTVNRKGTSDYISFILNVFNSDEDIETLPKVLEKKTKYVFEYEED